MRRWIQLTADEKVDVLIQLVCCNHVVSQFNFRIDDPRRLMWDRNERGYWECQPSPTK
jgi:hypothetical protein